jgi:hypothetical protein
MALIGEDGGGVELARLLGEALPWAKRRAIVDVLVEEAVGGDVRVAEYLLDRLYGRPGLAERAMGDGAMRSWT